MFFIFLTHLAGSLVEDIGEMILQLRRQVESLFDIKYGKLHVAAELNPHSYKGRKLCQAISFCSKALISSFMYTPFTSVQQVKSQAFIVYSNINIVTF